MTETQDLQIDVKYHYNQAVLKAIEIVKQLVRQALRENDNLTEYVMTMGDYYCKNTNGEILEFKYKPLEDFIAEWDDYLKLTGYPMRVTANGEVQTDW